MANGATRPRQTFLSYFSWNNTHTNVSYATLSTLPISFQLPPQIQISHNNPSLNNPYYSVQSVKSISIQTAELEEIGGLKIILLYHLPKSDIMFLIA